MMKKTITVQVEEKLFDNFKISLSMKNESITDVINEFIRNYVISNKAEVIDLMNEYQKNNIS